MARPENRRRVCWKPEHTVFKPAGIPMKQLDQVRLTVDELEAVRLADLEGLYQDAAAGRMKVSRQTFGRIVTSAHRKIAEVLVQGGALIIKGGNVEMADMRKFQCDGCEHGWEVPFGTGRPQQCPACGGGNFHRSDEQRGGGAGSGRGRCRKTGARDVGGRQRGSVTEE